MATLKVIAVVLGIGNYKSIKKACPQSHAVVKVNSLTEKASDAEWGNVHGEPSLIPTQPDLDSNDGLEDSWSRRLSQWNKAPSFDEEAVIPPSQSYPSETAFPLLYQVMSPHQRWPAFRLSFWLVNLLPCQPEVPLPCWLVNLPLSSANHCFLRFTG